MSVAIRNGSASTNGTTKRPAPSDGPHSAPSSAEELGVMQKMIDTQSMKSRGSAVSCRTRTNTGRHLARKRPATPSTSPEKTTNSAKVTRCGFAVETSDGAGKSTNPGRQATQCQPSAEQAHAETPAGPSVVSGETRKTGARA